MPDRPGIPAAAYAAADLYQITSLSNLQWVATNEASETMTIPKAIASTVDDARSVLAHVLQRMAEARQEGTEAGRKAGRAAVIESLHEVFGVNKLAAAFSGSSPTVLDN
jgi:uncharacterized membrane protein